MSEVKRMISLDDLYYFNMGHDDGGKDSD